MKIVVLLAAAALQTSFASAQPQAGPPTPPIAPPRDVAYPGVIRLAVDATDLERHIFTVHETAPVAAPGDVTLLYPKWLPGEHSPAGPVDQLAGLVVHGGGRRLEWVRDPVDVYAFHVAVPAGVSALDLDFQFVSPVETRVGRIVMTPDMLNLQWNAVSLYPAGYFTRGIPVEASVRLPADFKLAGALEPASTSGDTTTFKTVSYNTLVDSPLYAGRYLKRVDLDPGGPAPVHLNLFADKPEQLDATPEQLGAHKALVAQAYKLYGSHHYDHYDFLLALSDKLGGIGLEHHRSSENGTEPTYFTEWDKTPAGRDLLAHEYTHSWNGKFRRGADLWTPNFDVPMRDSLLWVYEGQTQYWGFVLAARAGLWTHDQAIDALALTAAAYDARIGRSWRALEDTTNDPIIAERRPLSWRSWQRSEDYYSEGQLIWLDADTLIRERSGGKRSLDDFARTFFGVENGSYVTKTYVFEDVVAALNAVQPYDWSTFLRSRLDGHGPGAPLDGLARGGYRLVYRDKPSDFAKSAETQRKVVDLTYSLGFVVGKEATLVDVLWDGPAYRAGLTAGTQILAVNGDTYDGDALKAAITAAKSSAAPLEIIVKSADRFRTVRLDYHGGLRYPRLERTSAGTASLDAIFTARK